MTSFKSSGLTLHLFLAAEGEQLAGQVGGPFARRKNLFQLLFHFGADVLAFHHKGRVAHDHGKDVVEIVRHTARELAESFHLLGLPELFLNVFALDELDDLTAHRREHPQQFVIRGSNLRAEKIDYSESLVPQPDGKRDCAAQT